MKKITDLISLIVSCYWRNIFGLHDMPTVDLVKVSNDDVKKILILRAYLMRPCGLPFVSFENNMQSSLFAL